MQIGHKSGGEQDYTFADTNTEERERRGRIYPPRRNLSLFKNNTRK